MTKTVTEAHPRHRRPETRKLIQLTDCHLYADPDAEYKGLRPRLTLEQVCRHIAEHHADAAALLLTGDLSQDESIESYRWLKSRIGQFKAPAYAIPGNHDKREQMLTAFSDSDSIKMAGGFVLGSWRILLLDSSAAGKTGGFVAEDELERLQRELERYPSAPSLVALHHHPLPIGSAWMDLLGLRNREALYSVLQRHEQVKAVLFGHVHQEFSGHAGHVLYLGTPSTCVQFRPKSLLYAEDTLPPAYRILNLHANGKLETQVEYVAMG